MVDAPSVVYPFEHPPNSIEQYRIIVGAVTTVGLILSVLVSCGAAIITG
ncbi:MULTISPECIES: hypothetical protein [Cryobacterium]|nr:MULTISPECIES: hypothetical protein [Cryobacterium]